MATRPIRRSVALYAGILLAASLSSTTHAQTTQITVDTHPLSFEVVSVRENNSSTRPMHMPDLGPTPDGYRATNSPLLLSLITAYPPTTPGSAFYSPAQISGLPDWATAAALRPHRQGRAKPTCPSGRSPPPRPACSTPCSKPSSSNAARSPCTASQKKAPSSSSWSQRTARSFKPTDPAEPHAGMSIPTGGVMMPGPQGMMAYGISTSTLAVMMSLTGGGQQTIIDHTGLTGRYDMVLKMRERAGPDTDPLTLVQQQLDELGLKLESGKAPIERLVIDHIERPSAN